MSAKTIPLDVRAESQQQRLQFGFQTFDSQEDGAKTNTFTKTCATRLHTLFFVDALCCTWMRSDQIKLRHEPKRSTQSEWQSLLPKGTEGVLQKQRRSNMGFKSVPWFSRHLSLISIWLNMTTIKRGLCLLALVAKVIAWLDYVRCWWQRGTCW
eukprot:1785057-Amphidinium_carterae.1